MPASIESVKQARDVSRPGAVLCLARAQGTSRVFVGSTEGRVHVVDLDQPKPEFLEVGRHESYVTGVALAGGSVISGAYDGRLSWWDAESHRHMRTVDAHTKWVRAVAASPDGKSVASIADDMAFRIWDAASGALIQDLRGHEERTPHHYPSMLHALAWSPDGLFVATGDKVGHIVVWEAATGRKAATLETPGMYTWDPVQRRHSIGGIRSLRFSPDGQRLAVGGIGKIGNIDHLEGKPRLEVFEWRTGKQTNEFNVDGTKGVINGLAFHPRNDWLLGAGGGNNGFLMFFDLAANKVIRNEKVGSHLHAVTLSDSADRLFAVGHGKVLAFEIA